MSSQVFASFELAAALFRGISCMLIHKKLPELLLYLYLHSSHIRKAQI